MSSELHRLLIPFAKSFKIDMPFWKTIVFLGVILREYPKTVQNNCIKKVSVHSFARTYVVNKQKDTFLFRGSRKFCLALRRCHKKLSMIYVLNDI